MKARAALASTLSLVALAPGAAMEGCAACDFSPENQAGRLVAGLLCGERYRGPSEELAARLTMRPNPVPSGDEVEFDASESTGRIVKYEWDIDPFQGTPFEVDAGDREIIERRVATAGYGDEQRQVTLRVTDSRGATATSTQQLTVIGTPYPDLEYPPHASFTFRPDPAILGESVHFDGSGSIDPDGGPLSYAWDFEDDGTFTGPGMDPSAVHVFHAPGIHPVRLRVTDPSGSSGQIVREVAVRAPARASAAAAGRRFTARIRSTLVSAAPDLVLRGQLKGRLRGRRQAGPSLDEFLSSRWLIRVSALRSRGTRLRGKGVALVRFAERRSGRACLRLRISTRPGRAPGGRFRVVGGTGAAARLGARGRFRFDAAKGTLRGTIAAREAELPPVPAVCRRLARP